VDFETTYDSGRPNLGPLQRLSPRVETIGIERTDSYGQCDSVVLPAGVLFKETSGNSSGVLHMLRCTQ